jgi:hypothetical protein
MIISCIDTKDAGFFSSFFFMVNHYLYAKINKHSFRLKTDNWLFKAEKGWEDYFLPIDFDPFVSNTNTNNQNDTQIHEIHNHAAILANYPMILYRNIIPEIYRLNRTTLDALDDARFTFWQKRGESPIRMNQKSLLAAPAAFDYGGLFIRRGDKLIEESILVSAEHYLLYLIEIYPNVQTVFVQTDDYNVFLELLAYQEKTPTIQHIQLYTLCKAHLKGGMVITKEKYDYCRSPAFETEIQKIRIPQNQVYLRTNQENLKAFVPLEMQTPAEIREHTTDMLIGIDFLLKSKVCVTDYLSNVTRFIKFAHPNIDAVYDVLRHTNKLDMNIVGCPGYGMNFYLPEKTERSEGPKTGLFFSKN